MTKVDAVRKLLQDNGGSAVWATIYERFHRYYKQPKSKHWQEGIRGVVYREERAKANFKVKDGVVYLRD
jgi:hypothetical protein